jgi:hypothetical protein
VDAPSVNHSAWDSNDPLWEHDNVIAFRLS